MCRLLAIRSRHPADVTDPLRRFAAIAKDSREYQGHGWGCAWIDDDGDWSMHHDIRPVWEDDLTRFPATRLLLAHARSAFRDEGIAVENNMPFRNGDLVFIFNGELHGVRIRAEGRIGAEKVFNVMRRFAGDGLEDAVRRGTEVIRRRTRYARAINVILSDGREIVAGSSFREDPDYFTMHCRGGDGAGSPLVICSEPWPETDRGGWTPIANGEVRAFR